MNALKYLIFIQLALFILGIFELINSFLKKNYVWVAILLLMDILLFYLLNKGIKELRNNKQKEKEKETNEKGNKSEN